MKIKLGIISLVLFLLPVTCFADISNETLSTLIVKSAGKYNILDQAVVMAKMIYCESGYDTDIQSKYYQHGIRENSWGLVQINLSKHLDVTKSDAIDPEFAVDFLAYNLSVGNGDLWKTCYHRVRDV